MRSLFHCGGWLLVLALAAPAVGQEQSLFNGRDLSGWEFHQNEEEPAADVGDAWRVDRGLLVSTGAVSGYLMHEGEFEDYALTLDWRWMRLNGNGVAVSGSGSVYVHTTYERGSFHAPKSVEVPLDRVGGVFMRDVAPFSDIKWAHTAPDFADDIERDMGEWNSLLLICRGDRITLYVNGTPVNQVDGLQRTKGAIALKSYRSMIVAPAYYRNLAVQPLTSRHADLEKQATQKLARYKAVADQARAAEEARRLAEEKAAEMKQDALTAEWATPGVAADVEFVADVRRLPYPPDAEDLEFDATFDGVEFTSRSSLKQLSAYYRTEMARRGWSVEEADADDDSVEVTFKHGECEVELTLDEESDGVSVEMDCEGLSFKGTDDPAALIELGVPQPQGYVFLQREIDLPEGVRNLEYEDGDSCMFKLPMPLTGAFDHFGGQLRAKGYRETRRPIVTPTRRYTEYAKGGVEVSVNVFTDPVGSRVILEYEAKR